MKTAWAIAAAVLVTASTSIAAPAVEGAQRPPRGVAVDATGKTIGPVFPYPGVGPMRILAKIDGAPVLIPTYIRIAFVDGAWIFPDTRELAPTSPTAVYYTEPSCQGTAFIPISEGETVGIAPSVVLAYGDGPATIYIGSTGPFQEVTVLSALNYSGDCIPQSSPVRGAPVVSVRDLANYFQVPYRLK